MIDQERLDCPPILKESLTLTLNYTRLWILFRLVKQAFSV